MPPSLSVETLEYGWLTNLSATVRTILLFVPERDLGELSLSKNKGLSMDPPTAMEKPKAAHTPMTSALGRLRQEDSPGTLASQSN